MKLAATEGIIISLGDSSNTDTSKADEVPQISVFVWSLQRTTYLKAFRWGDRYISGEKKPIASLEKDIRDRFPNHYPVPSQVDLSQQLIFDALKRDYPLTVKYFQKMPNGEYDLNRAYGWKNTNERAFAILKTPKKLSGKAILSVPNLPGISFT